jgi:hypothetical protein
MILMACWVVSCRSVPSPNAEPPHQILKVLPHWLDQQGRHTLSPSLFERDAYQQHLSLHRDEVSTMRFDVNWRLATRDLTGCTLHLEARVGRDDAIETIEHEVPLQLPSLRRQGWTGIQIPEGSWDPESNLMAWRVTLRQESTILATRTSFLW